MNPVRLKIRFSGICTHFRNVVPGIPHRVVLPEASQVRFRIADLAFAPDPVVSYYLVPHFPFLRAASDLSVPGVMTKGGSLYAGARLQVVNAINESILYDPSFRKTPSLRQFVPDYEYSDEVVHGRRAAAYLDVLGGVVSSEVVKGVTRVIIEMETDGPPQLMVVPFARGVQPKVVTLHPHDDGSSIDLAVANMEYILGEPEDPRFDFLLHYLTARGGIPKNVSQPMPGMGDNPQSPSPQSIAFALTALAGVIARGFLSDDELAQIDPDELTPACSDSQYP